MRKDMSAETAANTKVICIASTARSGSTLLHSLLAQLPGAFGAGELCFLWDLGVQQNWLCTCGRPFRECPTWIYILREAYGAEAIDAAADRCLRLRRAVRDRHTMLISLPGGRTAAGRRIEGYATELSRLLETIVKTQRCRIVIDSSKYASQAFALSRLPQFDVRIIHLVRDPRAVAYSQLTPKFDRGQGRMMRRWSPLKASRDWLVTNHLIEQTAASEGVRYLRLRYEKFVADPEAAMHCIARFIEEEEAKHLVHGALAEQKPNHGVSGNPIRFQTGSVRIAPDMRWRRDMRARDKAICTILALPLAHRYGYSIHQLVPGGGKWLAKPSARPK